MGLKETMIIMKEMLGNMSADLMKVAGGNKAAAQRVRTDSIHFAKFAKQFRKESLSYFKGEKKGKKANQKKNVKPSSKEK